MGALYEPTEPTLCFMHQRGPLLGHPLSTRVAQQIGSSYFRLCLVEKLLPGNQQMFMTDFKYGQSTCSLVLYKTQGLVWIDLGHDICIRISHFYTL